MDIIVQNSENQYKYESKTLVQAILNVPKHPNQCLNKNAMKP